MVNKGEKPTEVTLADGPILATELVHVLRTAWADTDDDWSTSVTINWEDGHSATIRKLDNLEPIEDAANVSSVSGHFSYADGSTLSLDIRQYSDNKLTAKGNTARSRQTEIAQFWAALPDRASLPAPVATGIWWFGFFAVCFVICGVLYTHLFTDEVVTLANWIYTGSLFFGGAAFLLFARSTATRRARRHPVRYHRSRRDTQQFWSPVAAIVGIASLVVAILTWLYPRN